jgi:high-affinity iron transporter
VLKDLLNGNFLIGLREGLEAALVVSILVAFLKKTGRTDRLPALWAGVGAAVVLSLSVGALLFFADHNLSFKAQEGFGGGTSVVAVAFVTWMIFWMKRNSRSLSGELHEKATAALQGGALAMAVTAFLATGREGLETALFLWPALKASASGGSYTVGAGAVLGITVAIVLAYLLYRRSIHLNLAKFFRYTGAGLVVVAAGVLAYGVHDLQEAGILPGLNRLAFDISSTISPASWIGTLLKGIFNFQPDPSWAQVVVYVAYLVPVMVLFLRKPAAAKQQPGSRSVAPSASSKAGVAA